MSAWHPQSPRAQRPGRESVWDYRHPVSERRHALRQLMASAAHERQSARGPICAVCDETRDRAGWWRRLLLGGAP